MANLIVDLDNLISATKSMIDFFWPSDSLNPPADEYLKRFVARESIKKDIGAICYTFYTMLWLSSGRSIDQRKVALKEITLRIFGILPQDDAEFIANATRTTYKQFFWACYQLDSSGYEEVVGATLIPALREMRDAIKERHNHHPVDY